MDFLGGGNSNIFYLHPYLGKIQILTNIFSNGLVQPPTSFCLGQHMSSDPFTSVGWIIIVISWDYRDGH